jgi:hypothetical protein
MVKEEVVKVINELRILTANYKKFREYVDTFACEPRCKKGVLDFVDTLLSYDNGDGKEYPPLFCCVLQRRLQDGFSRTATIKFIWILK